jgi:hypothetical protein
MMRTGWDVLGKRRARWATDAECRAADAMISDQHRCYSIAS